MTVAEALRLATSRLAAAGIATPELDAELLLRHVLGWDRARLIADAASGLETSAESGFFELVSRRAERRPLQHLTGVQAFWRHEFGVSPAVLIPRPETELLVEASLELLLALANPRIVDVGTGSGCIALSLAAERDDATVHATELSGAALRVAASNALRLGLADRVRFHEGDLLDPVRGERFELVVSNPPYVDPAARPDLAPEVRDHEPALALFPPDEPYAVYHRLVPQAANVLQPGGWLALEVGQGMAEEVAALCAGAGLAPAQPRRDLQGIPRVVVARRG